jgi:hypothetical protein
MPKNFYYMQLDDFNAFKSGKHSEINVSVIIELLKYVFELFSEITIPFTRSKYTIPSGTGTIESFL